MTLNDQPIKTGENSISKTTLSNQTIGIIDIAPAIHGCEFCSRSVPQSNATMRDELDSAVSLMIICGLSNNPTTIVLTTPISNLTNTKEFQEIDSSHYQMLPP